VKFARNQQYCEISDVECHRRGLDNRKNITFLEERFEGHCPFNILHNILGLHLTKHAKCTAMPWEDTGCEHGWHGRPVIPRQANGNLALMYLSGNFWGKKRVPSKRDFHIFPGNLTGNKMLPLEILTFTCVCLHTGVLLEPDIQISRPVSEGNGIHNKTR
jgi:hypothetical protein